MNSDLKQYMIDQEIVSQEQIQSAEEHSEKEKSSVEQALVSLGIMDIHKLGESFSGFYKMPYVRLIEKQPPQVAHSVLSRKCAEHWNVFPLDYNTHMSILTLAVDSPEHARRIERIYSFMMETRGIGFVVAAEDEIKDAVAKKYSPPSEPSSGQPKTEVQKKEEPKPGEKKKKIALSSLQKHMETVEQKKEGEPEQKKPSALSSVRPALDQKKPEERKQESSEELLASLTSAVSLLTASHLADDLKTLTRIRDRVRYCQLTAIRLNFSPEQTAKTIMAAWMSGLINKREVIKQFVNPYHLEGIVFPDESGDKKGPESLLLSLVRCYQDIEEEHGDGLDDVNMVRHSLHMRWSAAEESQDLLETFLQVLMDEQFLGKLDKHSGTVLLVDPSALLTSELDPALRKTGYKVDIVSTPNEAKQSIAEQVYNVVIVSVDSSAKKILEFCKQLKADEDTAVVPVIAIMSSKSEIRGAEFLRAGVDDFLDSPVDIELLYLKIDKQLASTYPVSEAPEEGVTGSLADMNFSDIIQMLSASCKSMEIIVSQGDLTGKVFLREGNVIHSELGDMVGDKAFYRLVLWNEGKFSMKECSDFPESTITSSTMSLLMEGARQADENITE